LLRMSTSAVTTKFRLLTRLADKNLRVIIVTITRWLGGGGEICRPLVLYGGLSVTNYV